MHWKMKFILEIMTPASKACLCSKYGKNFYKEFKVLSRKQLKDMSPDIPDIGDSIFSMSYLYAVCYFAWYKAARQLKINEEDALKLIWNMNENYIRKFPKPILRWFAKSVYIGSVRKKALEAEQRGKAGILHTFDWRIEYTNIDQNTFSINIYECALLKLAKRLDLMVMFPAICRIDYLFAHYFQHSFKRKGTLADGCSCCDCLYQFPGQCHWSPELGFEDRK